MTRDKPYQLPWPGADDRVVVEEMLRDPKSKHWNECHEFVKNLVHKRARNIPQDSWEDIIQEAMRKLVWSLPTFQHSCSLKTWVFSIVRSCIIDEYRRITLAMQYNESYEENELSDAFTIHISVTPEGVVIRSEEIRQIVIAIEEYSATHKKPERNRQILNMVLREGRSLEEAAKAVGCSAAVVGYVVRSAKRYIRDKLR